MNIDSHSTNKRLTVRVWIDTESGGLQQLSFSDVTDLEKLTDEVVQWCSEHGHSYDDCSWEYEWVDELEEVG